MAAPLSRLAQDASRTRKRILDATVSLTKQKGLYGFLRREVAKRARCATGTVSYHYASMAKLRKDARTEIIKGLPPALKKHIGFLGLQ